MPKLHLYRLSLFFVSFFGAFSASAQVSEVARDSPLLAIWLTWGPVLVIGGLWVFFMWRFFKSGSNKGLIATSLERMAKIEEHQERTSKSLEEVSKSLAELSEHMKRHRE